MVQDIRSHVDLLVNTLRENIDLVEVIIFGSHAHGEPTIDSDIDMCVVVADQDINKRVLLIEIRKLISSLMKYPLDILIYDKEEFYNKANQDTTLEHKIFEDGVKIYG